MPPIDLSVGLFFSLHKIYFSLKLFAENRGQGYFSYLTSDKFKACTVTEHRGIFHFVWLNWPENNQDF